MCVCETVNIAQPVTALETWRLSPSHLKGSFIGANYQAGF